MVKPYVALLGKAVRSIARLRGGGSALPGLFVEKIDPDFVRRSLENLSYGVVVVSGTNGKTTTTKMVVELLEGQGLKVFTNRTGSNFTRGVAAALLEAVDRSGHLEADIAVLELDEAHAVPFVAAVQPRFSLLLNVMRDQLDRFGEIDTTAKLLAKIAQATTDTVVLNREDQRVSAIASTLHSQKIQYFGLDPSLKHVFPSDDEMHGPTKKRLSKLPDADVTLTGFKEGSGQFSFGGQKPVGINLQLQGIYNVYNAAAAAAMVRAIMGKKVNHAKLTESLSGVQPAFGRGETITVGDQPVDLVLVKNPSGFRLSLQSFSPEGYATMIAMNDKYADGRDMSWLWDVPFDSLKAGVQEVSGIRAYDMALRLQYDEIAVSHVEPDLAIALRHFLEVNSTVPKRIYCTYTAMLSLRQELGKITTVERVL